jgi:hypothetical protein
MPKHATRPNPGTASGAPSPRIEATPLGLDTRFVVTNVEYGAAEWVYDTLYCARGQAENLIKLHYYIFADEYAAFQRLDRALDKLARSQKGPDAT